MKAAIPLTMITLLLLAGSACTDVRDAPLTIAQAGAARLSIRPQLAAGGDASHMAAVNRIVISARTVGDNQVVGGADRLVDPNAAQWSIPLDLSLSEGPARDVAIAIELMHIESGVQSVEYSGITIVSVAAGEQRQITNVPLYAGALAPITSITISPDQAALPIGQTLLLSANARDAQNNPLARLFTWKSSDSTIAVVSSTGVVNARRAGVVNITAQAESRSATAQVTVYAPAATSLVKTAGDAQSAPVNTQLTNALQVRVVDQQGGAVSGHVVQWFVTAGGGTVTPASSTTDASGIAQARLTVGPSTGAQTVEARAAGLTGSPVTFSATATAQQPAATITLAPATRTLTAGDTATFIATALDAAGNILRDVTYVWSTSDSTIAIVNASGRVTAFGKGSATISARSNNRTGTATLTVVTGAATAIRLYSGNGQVGQPGTQLQNDLVIRVVDAGSNPVSGTDVTFNVLSGGGSVSTRTVRSDADGFAATRWTLGPTSGTNQVEATANVPIGSPVVFTATAAGPQGVRKTWIGGNAANPTSWSNINNWSPVGIPSDLDTAVITQAGAGGANRPQAPDNVSVGTLIVQAGATLSNGGYEIRVRGSLDVAGAIVDNGQVLMTGTNTTVRGIISNLIIDGSATATGPMTLSENLVIREGGTFTMNGQVITVGKDFAAGGGVLVMTSQADRLIVGGRASFANNNETGRLTTGVITVAGDFENGCYNNTEFVPSGTQLVMAGTTPQAIRMCSSAAGNHLTGLTIANGSRVTISDPIYITGTMTVNGILTVTSTGMVDVAGPAGAVTIASTGVLNNNGVVKANLPIVRNGTVNGNPVVQR